MDKSAETSQNICHILTHAQGFQNDSDRNDEDYFQKVPAEVALIVFSYLDDFSTWCASRVCTRWETLLVSTTPSERWQRLAFKCWPLRLQNISVDNWYDICCTMNNNAPCITTLRDIYECRYVPFTGEIDARRKKLLEHEVKYLKKFHPEGVTAIPLDKHFYHWQATIRGPAQSPFKNGLFYLYFIVPYEYPEKSPVFKFLTKIFHPNVSDNGDIHEMLLAQEWKFSASLSKWLISIKHMLNYPNEQNFMNDRIACIYQNDREKYFSIAIRYTREHANNFPPRN